MVHRNNEYDRIKSCGRHWPRREDREDSAGVRKKKKEKEGGKERTGAKWRGRTAEKRGKGSKIKRKRRMAIRVDEPWTTRCSGLLTTEIHCWSRWSGVVPVGQWFTGDPEPSPLKIRGAETSFTTSAFLLRDQREDQQGGATCRNRREQ